MGVGGQCYAPADLPQCKWLGSHCTRGCLGPRVGLHEPGKISPPGFDSLTVQPVASRYTDWANARRKSSQRLLAMNCDEYRLPVQKNTQHKAHNSQRPLVLLQKPSNVPHLTLFNKFPWSTALHHQTSQVPKKSPTLYGTRRFITVFTKAVTL